MKKYFKEVRENLVAQYLNDSEMVYSGYHNNEYIRKQLSAFIGQIVKNLHDYGVDTVTKEHDTSFSIALRTATKYIKAYRTQKSYCEAIEEISMLFDKYDNKYIEVEDEISEEQIEEEMTEMGYERISKELATTIEFLIERAENNEKLEYQYRDKGWKEKENQYAMKSHYTMEIVKDIIEKLGYEEVKKNNNVWFGFKKRF